MPQLLEDMSTGGYAVALHSHTHCMIAYVGMHEPGVTEGMYEVSSVITAARGRIPFPGKLQHKPLQNGECVTKPQTNTAAKGGGSIRIELNHQITIAQQEICRAQDIMYSQVPEFVDAVLVFCASVAMGTTAANQ